MHIIRWLVKFIGIAAAIWTVGVSVYIIFAPTQSQFSQHMTLSDGTTVREEGYITKTLMEREGWIGVISFILGAVIGSNIGLYNRSQSGLAPQTRIIVGHGRNHVAFQFPGRLFNWRSICSCGLGIFGYGFVKYNSRIAELT